eukprot:3971467-Pyramimonas_sp.AAC.1
MAPPSSEKPPRCAQGAPKGTHGAQMRPQKAPETHQHRLERASERPPKRPLLYNSGTVAGWAEGQ